MLKLRNIFLINTVIALLFALGLLLVPSVLLDLFGFSNSADIRLLGQLFGAELLVGGLVTYFSKDSSDFKTRQGIITANLIATVIGFIVSLGGMLSGVMNPLGWLIVAVYLLLAAGFGYSQFFGSTD